MEDILLSKNNTKYGGNALYWYCCDLTSAYTCERARTHAQTYIIFCIYIIYMYTLFGKLELKVVGQF